LSHFFFHLEGLFATPTLPGLCITIIFLVDVYLPFCFCREVVCANENHKEYWTLYHFNLLFYYIITAIRLLFYFIQLVLFSIFFHNSKIYHFINLPKSRLCSILSNIYCAESSFNWHHCFPVLTDISVATSFLENCCFI
jgi:hypothetical protein